jgi:hypothetical protein
MFNGFRYFNWEIKRCFSLTFNIGFAWMKMGSDALFINKIICKGIKYLSCSLFDLKEYYRLFI